MVVPSGEELRVGDDQGDVDGLLVTVHPLLRHIVGPALLPVVRETENDGVFGEPLLVQIVQYGCNLLVHY